MPLKEMEIDNCFGCEREFSDHFVSVLNSGSSPWGRVKSGVEFNYSGGRPDVVAKTDDNRIFAFELKLKKWKEAVHQAYRCTSFAQESYAVLPNNVAARVKDFDNDFDVRGIGLCTIYGNEIRIIRNAPTMTPIQEWLNTKVSEFVENNGTNPGSM